MFLVIANIRAIQGIRGKFKSNKMTFPIYIEIIIDQIISSKKLKKNKSFIIKALMLVFSAIIKRDDKFGNSEFNKDIIFDRDIEKMYWDNSMNEFENLNFKSPLKELKQRCLR